MKDVISRVWKTYTKIFREPPEKGTGKAVVPVEKCHAMPFSEYHQDMTSSPETPSPISPEYIPFDAALAALPELIEKLFSYDVPFGEEGEFLDQIARFCRVIEEIQLLLERRMAQLESSGSPLERGRTTHYSPLDHPRF